MLRINTKSLEIVAKKRPASRLTKAKK